MMRLDLMVSLAALVILAGGSFASVRQPLPRDARFWAMVGAALTGTGAAAAISLQVTGFGIATALWLTSATALAVFAALAALRPVSARLGTLLFPYLSVLALLAIAFAGAPGETAETSAWGVAHAGIALIANALVTVAAVAAVAVMIQERALKARRRSAFAGVLPGAAESESVQGILLGFAAAALALGIATGSALQLMETGRFLVLNHKTVLTLAAMALLAGLSVAELRSGLGGRKLARGILIGWLALTLGFLGVIFVKQILLA
jgi:ABC-type uncharacterized transport system permease subunit